MTAQLSAVIHQLATHQLAVPQLTCHEVLAATVVNCLAPSLIHTVGVAPISNPRLALVVMVNEPKGEKIYGGAIAAPILSKVLGSALQILNIRPDAKTLQQDKGA